MSLFRPKVSGVVRPQLYLAVTNQIKCSNHRWCLYYILLLNKFAVWDNRVSFMRISPIVGCLGEWVLFCYGLRRICSLMEAGISGEVERNYVRRQNAPSNRFAPTKDDWNTDEKCRPQTKDEE